MAAYILIIEHHLKPAFKFFSQICNCDIQNFINQKVAAGLSVKSVKDMVMVLKMILRYGEKLGCFPYEKLEVKYPKDFSIKTLPVLTVDQQKRLLDHLVENMNSKNLGIILCLYTGLRIGELCALKWKDIDVANSVIRIDKTISRIYAEGLSGNKTSLVLTPAKTIHSNRIIPICDRLREIIKTRFGDISGECYVLTGTNVPTEPRAYRNYFYRMLKKLDLPHIKFHGLRHSFATRCIESKCDYKSVSEILGHSDISTTLNLYVHPSLEQKKNCIEQMLDSISD